MTVGELIQELQQFDTETEVYCYQIHDDMGDTYPVSDIEYHRGTILIS